MDIISFTRTLSRAICVVGLFLSVVCVSDVKADYSVSDPLSGSDENWTPLFAEGNASIIFQNSRAELVTPTGTLSDRYGIFWSAGFATFDDDWSAQVDVHLDVLPLTSGQYVNLNLAVANALDNTKAYTMSIDRYTPLGESSVVSEFEAISADGMNQSFVVNGAVNGSIKITFDATTKVLTSWWNTGSGWNALGDMDITSEVNNWGMTSGDSFGIALVGSSGTEEPAGTGPAILSGEAYFTNFQGSVIPEPSSALLLLGGLGCLVVAQRFRRAGA